MDVHDTSSSLTFSEDDVRTQLELLGYRDIPRNRLHQFAKDLEKLIANESMQNQLYTDDSAVSDSYASAAEFPARETNRGTLPPTQFSSRAPDIGREPVVGIGNREVRRSDEPKQQVHRDHTMYGKENHTVYRPVTAPSFHPRRDVDDPIDSSFASSRSEVDLRGESLEGAAHRWAQPRRKPPMKRKVLRKKGGQSHVFDESITESEADLSADISYLNDHLQDIPLPSHEIPDTLLTDDSSDVSYVPHRIPNRRKPETASTLYSHRPSGDEDSVFKPHLPRSFIRPSSAQPKLKHDEKTDPVSRHRMYQAAWNAKKAPGEKTRKDLRWNVREQMMYKDELPKPQNQPRVYLPNSYKVPTEKKRQALRWAVRTSLAHKQMPNASAFEF